MLQITSRSVKGTVEEINAVTEGVHMPVSEAARSSKYEQCYNVPGIKAANLKKLQIY